VEKECEHIYEVVNVHVTCLDTDREQYMRLYMKRCIFCGKLIEETVFVDDTEK
jgi:hypothetical protein